MVAVRNLLRHASNYFESLSQLAKLHHNSSNRANRYFLSL